MKANRYSFDVQVRYKDGAFESFRIDGVLDREEAVIKAMNIRRFKNRKAVGGYHTVASLEVVPTGKPLVEIL